MQIQSKLRLSASTKSEEACLCARNKTVTSAQVLSGGITSAAAVTIGPCVSTPAHRSRSGIHHMTEWVQPSGFTKTIYASHTLDIEVKKASTPATCKVIYLLTGPYTKSDMSVEAVPRGC